MSESECSCNKNFEKNFKEEIINLFERNCGYGLPLSVVQERKAQIEKYISSLEGY